MSSFDQIRGDLAASRAKKRAADTELTAARERLRYLQRTIDDLQRRPGSRAGEDLPRLKEQAARLSNTVNDLRTSATGHRSTTADLLGRLAAVATPPELLRNWSDTIPIALLPVRLETRFHRAVGRDVPGGAAPTQLWIRIYPDEPHIDAFEELLTESEVDSARAYWAAVWRSGRIEAQERGAWSSLVGAMGSGRAAYVIEQYTPLNPAARPSKVDPQDVVLVIVPRITVTAGEQTAAIAYFVEVWKAKGDRARQATALTTLQAAVGSARADEILEGFAPDEAGQDPPAPYSRAQVQISVAILELPPPPTTKTNAWTKAPKAVALPDRFVALLWSGNTLRAPVIGRPIPDGLAVGPDPSLPADEQIAKDGDDLTLNEDLRWMVDFEVAADVGMGIKVDLTSAEAAAGFDRLIVLGLRFSSDQHESADLLSTLVAHRYASKSGFSLVPQGSATNNTEGDGAAFTWVDDPDASFDAVFKGSEAYTETTDPFQRRDGEWLAEALGIDSAVMKRLPHAGGRDQAEARAMNLALWPATLGYAMEEMLTPIFSREDIARTRGFFASYVSGRGPLPAVRFGRQPYGVLPAMAFSRYRAITDRVRTDVRFGVGDYLQRLHTLLARLDQEWRRMSGAVPHVGNTNGNAHQTLLDIVGLHSGSVEYHQRYAESFDQLYNKLTLQFGEFFGGLLAAWMQNRSRQVLTQAGVTTDTSPPILDKFFYGESPLLSGPVVDDSPLSETRPIRAYTPDKRNYIQWLATSSLDIVRREDFGGNPAPAALLYLFLRHAMMLGHWDAGTRFLEARALVNPVIARREPSFVHVEEAADAGLSKFHHLYAAQPVITGDPTITLSEYMMLPSVLATAAETVDLRQVLAALALLANAPTARLERLFAEHIDCCSYRLDAWKTGLATRRLEEMRRGEQEAEGIHLGSFGWLEDVRPRPGAITPVQLDAELSPVFQRPGEASLGHDTTNAGFIHAPSLNHAATAAILKNAYRVNASPAKPDAMAVNLTSDRVRNAMAVLEGIRNGQSMAALLGYRFERGLHDAHNLAEVDKFIYPLRQVFPLVANHLRSTKPNDPTDITLLEARNVLDGLNLVARVRTQGNGTYPFGFQIGTGPGQLPSATQPERDAITAQADAVASLYDAIADLVLAESTYQVVLGNFDRAAANTEAFSKGSYPPETQIVHTPRTGVSLTHRVALHLDTSANPAVSPSVVPMTVRAKADAPLNLWLSTRMPAPTDVVVQVKYSSPVVATNTVTVTQVQLGLQPIDLLMLVDLDLEQAQAELDDRINQVVRFGPDAHPDLAITIEYTQPVPGRVTLFELSAFVRSLRTLILKSRALGATDMAMPLESKADEAVWDDADLTGRVNAAIADLTARRNALVTLSTAVSDLDDYARDVSNEFLSVALFGLPQTGVGQIHADMRAIYDAVAAKVQEFVDRWNQKDTDYTLLLATWPTLTSDEERHALLVKAEGLISNSTTAQPPADPNVYKTTIVDPAKLQFDSRLTQLNALRSFSGKLVTYASTANTLAPLLAQHDAVPFDVAPQLAAITSLRASLVSRVDALAADLTQRMTDAQNAVTDAAALETADARVQQLLTGAKRVLGDEAPLIPRFFLAEDRGIEFDNGVAGSTALLTDLVASGRRFPVDDWVSGLARVRDKMAAWENAAILSEAFGATEAPLTPVQLPFVADDRWLAMEFDPSRKTPSTRLLYTAQFAAAFNRTAAQCGLLLDDWTELVPGTDIVSGVTFHFDRPSSQPPQAVLLAVPSALTGAWQWDDLVALLVETLDAAKARAVSPSQVDASPYAQFLPATLMAVTLYQITIGTNLAMNNRIYELIRS